MTLLIDRSLPYASLPSDVSLRDTNCTAQISTTHYIITTGYHECGTNVKLSGNEYIFDNVVTVVPKRSPNDVVMTYKHVPTSIEIICRFDRSLIVETDLEVSPGIFFYYFIFALIFFSKLKIPLECL